MVAPWLNAGYECWLVDIQHLPGISKDPNHNLYRVGVDLTYPLRRPAELSGEIILTFAAPPCDHLAVSGARWFKGKGLRKLAWSIQLFATAAEMCEAIGAPYGIENPVSTISTYWRKPDYRFHPWQYCGFEPSDNYNKKTCLWTGNGFVMPPHNYPANNPPPDNRIHTAAPGPDRANFRRASPLGFARAVFEANSGFL